MIYNTAFTYAIAPLAASAVSDVAVGLGIIAGTLLAETVKEQTPKQRESSKCYYGLCGAITTVAVLGSLYASHYAIGAFEFSTAMGAMTGLFLGTNFKEFAVVNTIAVLAFNAFIQNLGNSIINIPFA